MMEKRSILHYRASAVTTYTKVNYCVDRVSHQTINNECILHCQVLYSLLSSSRDPFVLESNPSGHPSSVSGDPIARCKRWIEREIFKPSVLIDCQLDGYQTIIIMSRSCQKLLVSPLKTSHSISAFDTNCRAFVIISQPFRVHFCNM